ncbi:MAG TPA: hypothetical protein VLD67_17690 [Vicinamibacterales bacterium]|nr:hypothetical protein [Vicinamibacterales bacterium]
MPTQDESLGATLIAQLRARGVDVEALCTPRTDGKGVRVACLVTSLRESMAELGASVRDEVVMVRVDGATRDALDGWVRTGAVRSRSEAAALFIREGLKLRESEFAELREAVRKVDRAERELQRKAKRLLGAEPGEEGEEEMR